MRIYTALIIALSMSPAYAKIYKCSANGKVSFQEKPCHSTESGGEFNIKKDISLNQQKAAVSKLNSDLAILAEKQRLAREAVNEERKIRAEENKARATYLNAMANREQAIQAKRQAKALESRNQILNNRPIYYGGQEPKPKLSK